jgi:ABC-2 type transport system permease protein
MPDWLRAIVENNPVSWMTTAARGLMAGGVTLTELALAVALPVALTAALAPLTLWLNARK